MTGDADLRRDMNREIPAYAGMTGESAGMTRDADMRRDTNREIPAFAGMTRESAGMTESPTCRGDMLEYQGFEGSSTTRNGTGAARRFWREGGHRLQPVQRRRRSERGVGRHRGPNMME